MDLGFLRFVSAIGTQGAISQETRRVYFVKSYKVDVSSNGEDWITLKEGSKQKVGDLLFLNLCVIKVSLASRGLMTSVDVFCSERKGKLSGNMELLQHF